MFSFFESTFVKNSLGLFVMIITWIIFSAIGLRGVTYGKSITTIRQETGLSLLTMTVFLVALIGLVTFLTTQGTTPAPFPS